MSTTTTTKGGDLSALLGGGPESPVPNPDMLILTLRAVAALILGLWYGGQAGHDRLLAWADRAFLAFIKQPDGSWMADRPIQLGGDLIRWFYATAVQGGLAWAALAVMVMLLVELLGMLLLLQLSFSAPTRRTTAAYRLRTLNPANRARFPTSLDGGSLWAALIGALDPSSGGVCLTLHCTANSTATLGVQISAPWC